MKAVVHAGAVGFVTEAGETLRAYAGDVVDLVEAEFHRLEGLGAVAAVEGDTPKGKRGKAAVEGDTPDSPADADTPADS